MITDIMNINNNEGRAKVIAYLFGYSCKSICCISSIFELIKHLIIEEVVLIKNIIEIITNII